MSYFRYPKLSLIALMGALACSAAFAQGNYPAKPIRMILPYATGGSASALAHAIAEDMQATLGQPVIVESRPGANSMTGAEIVAQTIARDNQKG